MPDISHDPGHTNDPPRLHEFVALWNGLQGEVIGFYRRTAESVLLRLESGECVEALMTNVERRPTDHMTN
jgi:hypothetical protein